MVQFSFDIVGYALNPDVGPLDGYSAAVVSVLGRSLIGDGGENAALDCQGLIVNGAGCHPGDFVVIPDKRRGGLDVAVCIDDEKFFLADPAILVSAQADIHFTIVIDHFHQAAAGKGLAYVGLVPLQASNSIDVKGLEGGFNPEDIVLAVFEADMTVVYYEPGGPEIHIGADHGGTGGVAYVICLSANGLDREPLFIGGRVGGYDGGEVVGDAIPLGPELLIREILR